MNTYRHTQIGTLIIAALIGAVCVIAGIASTVTPQVIWALPMMLLAVGLFYSLTIEIRDGELHWSFGPGLIHKRVRVDEIASAEPVRTRSWEGWGIHLSRFGWLYNVSGFGAVAIRMQSGKRFALGTDEPEELAKAILESRARATGCRRTGA